VCQHAYTGNGKEQAPVSLQFGETVRTKTVKGWNMSIGTILLVVLVLMLVGVLPVWPHATSWGYGPSGIVGVLLIIIIVLFLMGRL
jgi:hypothetical protein